MPFVREGTSGIIEAARVICRLYRWRGAPLLASRTSPAFVAAVQALNAACLALEAVDDFPFEIDPDDPTR